MQRILLALCAVVAFVAALAVPQPSANAATAPTLYFPVMRAAATVVPARDEATQRIQVPAGFDIRILKT